MTAFAHWRPARKPGRDAKQDPLRWQLKVLVTELFRNDIADPSKILDSEPLLGGKLGLDSLDLVEIAIWIEEEHGRVIKRGEEAIRAFASITSLADFIHPVRPNPSTGQKPGRVAINEDIFFEPGGPGRGLS